MLDNKSKNKKRPAFAKKIELMVIEEYCNTNTSFKELSNKYGVPYATIKEWCFDLATDKRCFFIGNTLAGNTDNSPQSPSKREKYVCVEKATLNLAPQTMVQPVATEERFYQILYKILQKYGEFN